MPTTDNPRDVLDTETASKISNYVRTKAQQLAPNMIAPWITSADIEQSADGKYGIKIRVDLKKIPDRSPAKSARAYEYGSGTHAQRGKVGRYKIEPRNPNGYLIFPWDKLPQTQKQAERNPDKLIFKKLVMHPGVEAANNGRGYMREALVQSQDYIRQTILKDASENIKLKVRAIFSRPGGKNK